MAGDVVVRSLQPDEGAGLSLSPGVWCLQTRSTVPYVRVESGEYTRTFTWGEALEIKKPGKIINASAHAGDVYLAPVVAGVVSPKPPALMLPVEFATPPLLQQQVSQWFDVRHVVRGYFTFLEPATNPPTVPVFPQPFVIQQRITRGIASFSGFNLQAGAAYDYAPLIAPGDVVVNLAANLSGGATIGDNRSGGFFDQLRLLIDSPPLAGQRPVIVLQYL